VATTLAIAVLATLTLSLQMMLPSNELRIFDINVDITLVFGEDGRVKARSGKVPLTWFSDERNALKELIQSVA